MNRCFAPILWEEGGRRPKENLRFSSGLLSLMTGAGSVGATVHPWRDSKTVFSPTETAFSQSSKTDSGSLRPSPASVQDAGVGFRLRAFALVRRKDTPCISTASLIPIDSAGKPASSAKRREFSQTNHSHAAHTPDTRRPWRQTRTNRRMSDVMELEYLTNLRF